MMTTTSSWRKRECTGSRYASAFSRTVLFSAVRVGTAHTDRSPISALFLALRNDPQERPRGDDDVPCCSAASQPFPVFFISCHIAQKKEKKFKRLRRGSGRGSVVRRGSSDGGEEQAEGDEQRVARDLLCEGRYQRAVLLCLLCWQVPQGNC